MSFGFNRDFSRGRFTWKLWMWGGFVWVLGVGFFGRRGIGSFEGWVGRGVVKKYGCRRVWGGK